MAGGRLSNRWRSIGLRRWRFIFSRQRIDVRQKKKVTISHIGIKFAFEGFRLVHGFADRFAEGRVLSEGRVFGLDLRDAVYPRRFDLLRPIGDGALAVHFVIEDRLRFHRFKVFDVDVLSVL